MSTCLVKSSLIEKNFFRSLEMVCAFYTLKITVTENTAYYIQPNTVISEQERTETQNHHKNS